MFLLTEEFMRRYKDRWIIGAYDCINEPISMTPRREELTPKLVYFYEEMIRRCRKIDQKHLFLLNGTQFSSLTYFFDHELTRNTTTGASVFMRMRWLFRR